MSGTEVDAATPPVDFNGLGAGKGEATATSA
jgi:hypothetical protein